MKILKYILSLCVVVLALTTCSDDEKDLNFISNVEAPSELAMLFQVTQDNTGFVTITPTAEGAVGFDIYFGDDTLEPENFSNGQNTSHTYVEGTYTVTAVAYGVTGLETTLAQELVVSFQAPSNLEVTIENDAAISKRVNVTASADFAVSFDVTSLGTTEETPSPVTGNIGETVFLDFLEPGTYTITVEAMGAAIETTVYTEDFEVTEIISPLTSAPTPPSRQPDDVISLYSDVYTNIELSELNPGWGQTTTLTEVQVEGNNTWFYNDLNYTGIVTDYGNATDVSAMEFVHFDYWTPDATVLGLKLVNTSYADGDPLKEDIEFVDPISLGEWVSVDISLAEYTTDVSGITQLLYDTTGNNAIVYVDNLYFYREATDTSLFDDGLLTNGDFELGSESWLVGVDPASAAPVTTDTAGNTYYSVNVTNPDSTQPYLVNTSQFVELISGETYTLTYDAWSDANRSIIAGIGLSANPWTNVSETVDITTTRTTYSYTFETIGFGDPQARVIFDLNAVAGVVNLDNVGLYLGDGPTQGFDDGLLTNGDFELGSESWLVGVDPASAAPVTTDTAGNTYYSVNVTNPDSTQPYLVNTSQFVELISGETYTLTYDAWSDANRSIIAGIGLSANPWTNVSETVDITTTRTTYSYTFETIGFGDPQARVIFDLNAVAGVVNLDNVSLTLD